MGAGDARRFAGIFKTMKVALCLFGLAGGTQGKDGKGETIDPTIAFEYYREHIFSKNDIDVYFHTWSLERGAQLIELYNPVKYIIEPPAEFSCNPRKQRARSRRLVRIL